MILILKNNIFLLPLLFLFILLFSFYVFPIPTYAALKTEEYKYEYDELYNTLSNTAKDILNKYEVYFLKDNLRDYDEFKTISGIEITRGLIKYNTNQIYISYNKSYTKYNRIFYHEVGHALDCSNIHNDIIERYSDSTNFLTLYEKYKKSDINLYSDEEYFKSNSKEFFAECFAIYMIHPEKRYLVPEIYDLFDKITKTPIKETSENASLIGVFLF